MNISPEYLAGVIDSDGSISIIKRRNQTTTRGYAYRELVQITWNRTDLSKQVLNEIKAKYGGSVFETRYKPTAFRANELDIVKFTAEAKAAQRVLESVLPFLILKRQQALNALKMRALKSNQWGTGNPKSSEVWVMEDAIYEETLKQRPRGKSE